MGSELSTWMDRMGRMGQEGLLGLTGMGLMF